MIWVEMRRLPLLPAKQSGCVLVGSAAVGKGARIGVFLDVTSLVLSADPAPTKTASPIKKIFYDLNKALEK